MLNIDWLRRKYGENNLNIPPLFSLKGVLSGLRQFFATESPLKCFLFHLKSSFRSQDI